MGQLLLTGNYAVTSMDAARLLNGSDVSGWWTTTARTTDSPQFDTRTGRRGEGS